MNSFKHLKGGAELQRMLDTLPAKVEKNIMRGAMRAGAKPIAEDARANVPEEHGDLKESIRISTKSKNGVVMASVKAGSKKAWYWHFVEFGTAEHLIKAKKGGSLFFGTVPIESVLHPGAKAKPFMRPAMDNRAADALTAVGEYVGKRLTKQGLEAPPMEVEDVS